MKNRLRSPFRLSPGALVLGACALLVGCGARPAAKRLLIIDDDVGMDLDAVRMEGAYDAPPGVHYTDPDGGLELLYALHDPSVELLGVTCTYGTVSESLCEGAARKVLDAAGRPDIAVYAGATGASDLGHRTAAVDFLITTLMARPGEIEIASSGPFTNVASALMIEPSLSRQWKTLHIMSGEFQMGSDVSRFAGVIGGDLNLSLDEPGTQFVFDHGGAFPMYPNELMDQAVLTYDDVASLAAASPLGAFVQAQLKAWLPVSAAVMNIDGCYPHGMIAMAVALDPSLGAAAFTAPITLETIAPPMGKHAWGSIVTARSDGGSSPPHIVYMGLPGASRFRARYLQRLR